MLAIIEYEEDIQKSIIRGRAKTIKKIESEKMVQKDSLKSSKNTISKQLDNNFEPELKDKNIPTSESWDMIVKNSKRSRKQKNHKKP
jgi:hypothetical protein